jgi:anti-sigma factor RsiW
MEATTKAERVDMNEEQNKFDAALKSRATSHTAPASLRARILADLAAEATPSAAVPRRAAPVSGARWFNWRGMASGFAMGALCAVFTVGLYLRAGSDDRLADEVVAGHVRALMTGHVSDVVSTDRHTVKPWFAGKLDFSPPVWNEQPGEFPLVGGRVDYLNKRAVAALVYKRNEHVINVFVWPTSEKDRAGVSGVARQGFQSLKWTAAGMQYWAVSDVGVEELQRFFELQKG